MGLLREPSPVSQTAKLKQQPRDHIEDRTEKNHSKPSKGNGTIQGTSFPCKNDNGNWEALGRDTTGESKLGSPQKKNRETE